MKTTITTFEFPKAAIRISNLEIDVEKRKAFFTLGIKEHGKRKEQHNHAARSKILP